MSVLINCAAGRDHVDIELLFWAIVAERPGVVGGGVEDGGVVGGDVGGVLWGGEVGGVGGVVCVNKSSSLCVNDS